MLENCVVVLLLVIVCSQVYMRMCFACHCLLSYRQLFEHLDDDLQAMDNQGNLVLPGVSVLTFGKCLLANKRGVRSHDIIY